MKVYKHWPGLLSSVLPEINDVLIGTCPPHGPDGPDEETTIRLQAEGRTPHWEISSHRTQCQSY